LHAVLLLLSFEAELATVAALPPSASPLDTTLPYPAPVAPESTVIFPQLQNNSTTQLAPTNATELEESDGLGIAMITTLTVLAQLTGAFGMTMRKKNAKKAARRQAHHLPWAEMGRDEKIIAKSEMWEYGQHKLPHSIIVVGVLLNIPLGVLAKVLLHNGGVMSDRGSVYMMLAINSIAAPLNGWIWAGRPAVFSFWIAIKYAIFSFMSFFIVNNIYLMIRKKVTDWKIDDISACDWIIAIIATIIHNAIGVVWCHSFIALEQPFAVGSYAFVMAMIALFLGVGAATVHFALALPMAPDTYTTVKPKISLSRGAVGGVVALCYFVWGGMLGVFWNLLRPVLQRMRERQLAGGPEGSLTEAFSSVTGNGRKVAPITM